MKGIRVYLGWAGMVCIMSAGQVLAQSAWQGSVTPYLWMAGMEGDVGVRGAVGSVDRSFTDILDDLEFALMLRGEATRDRIGLFADGLYLDLSDSRNTLAGKVETGVEQWLFTAGAFYRAVEEDSLTVDVGAGGRYISTDVDIVTPANRGGGSDQWVDPILTAGIQWKVDDVLALRLDGDIGGFGVESDLVWQLAASVNLQVSDAIAVIAGYRILDYDYEQDQTVYDVAMEGLEFGLEMSF